MKYLEFAIAETGYILHDAFSKQFDIQDDFSPSTISFSLDRSDPRNLTFNGTTVQVSIDGKKLKTTFLISGNSVDYVTEDGIAARAYTGKSIHSIFEDASVLPSAWPNPAPAGHDFQNATPGNIIKTLIARVQEFQYITTINTDSFTGTHDSNGVQWPSMMDRSYTTGDSILSAIQGMYSDGYCDAEMDGNSLNLYVPGTLDKTLSPSTVTFRVGQNLTEASAQTDSSDFYTDIFAIGEGAAVPVMKSRPASYGVLGRRRMRFAQYGGITNSALLGVLADIELDQYNHIKTERSCSVSPDFYTPFIDYDVHNLVPFDKGDGSLENIRIKQISVTQSDGDGSFSVGVTLGDLLEDADEKLKRRLDAITGANAGGGAIPSDKTDDKLAPAAPNNVSISVLDYIANDNTRKIGATVDWPDVNTNSDGTPASDIDHYEIQTRSGTSTPTGSPSQLIPARADSTWSALFDRRGKAGLQSISGIVSGSTRLPNGKDLWVQNSVYLGTPNGENATGVTKIDNALVQTDPTDQTVFNTITGSSNKAIVSTADLGVTPESGFTIADYSVSLGAPFQANNKVYTAVSLLRNVTAGNSSSKTVSPGMWIAQWNPSTLAREALTSVSSTISICTADASYVEGSYVYFYGHSGTTASRFLGRVALSSPFAVPLWSDAAGNWGSSATAVTTAPISSVRKIGSTYFGLITEGTSKIRQVTSTNLWGPWTTSLGNVYDAPEAINGRTVASPTFHPQFDSSTGMEMLYSIASTQAPSTSIYLAESKAIRGPGAGFLPVGLDTATWSSITKSDISKSIIMGLIPMTSFQAQVRTVDNNGLVSAWTQSDQVVLKGTETAVIPKPSTPTGYELFQGVQVYWNGVDFNGNALNGDVANVEVHVSDQSASFVPGEATRSFIWSITSTQPQLWNASITGLQTEKTYWVKLVAQGKGGSYSDPSDPLSITTAKLFTVDMPQEVLQVGVDLATAQDEIASAQHDLYEPGGTVDLINTTLTGVKDDASTALQNSNAAGQQALDAYNEAQAAKLAASKAGAVVRIDSSKGFLFKQNTISTVLSVSIFKGDQTIEDIIALQAAYGAGAYLEWQWRRDDDTDYGTISSSDPRIGSGGFTFTLSPNDVATKVVFRCTVNGDI